MKGIPGRRTVTEARRFAGSLPVKRRKLARQPDAIGRRKVSAGIWTRRFSSPKTGVFPAAPRPEIRFVRPELPLIPRRLLQALFEYFPADAVVVIIDRFPVHVYQPCRRRGGYIFAKT
ncbi:MAG: hypothetical protein Pg6C_14170 [Treponemataceae bacterium]|nr:MAG: hypothetical protein Pg6C_14170 [Treponemataceae bacterium]